jgi:hypothetical protein
MPCNTVCKLTRAKEEETRHRPDGLITPYHAQRQRRPKKRPQAKGPRTEVSSGPLKSARIQTKLALWAEQVGGGEHSAGPALLYSRPARM